MTQIRTIKALAYFIILIISGGCSSPSGSGMGSGDEAFSEIPDLSVTCEAADGGPAVCTDSQNGKPVVIGWTSGACVDFNPANLVAYENRTLNCVAGVCMAHDSVSWRSPLTHSIIYRIPPGNQTAIAWLNLVNHGASDALYPQSGDVLCCQIETSDYADIPSTACQLIP